MKMLITGVLDLHTGFLIPSAAGSVLTRSGFALHCNWKTRGLVSNYHWSCKRIFDRQLKQIKNLLLRSLEVVFGDLVLRFPTFCAEMLWKTAVAKILQADVRYNNLIQTVILQGGPWGRFCVRVLPEVLHSGLVNTSVHESVFPHLSGEGC